MIQKKSSPSIIRFSPIVAFLLTLLLFNAAVKAQEGMTITMYIESYKDIAMAEMREHGIPASIKLGQGILESGFGNSKLAVRANNHFGIKCHGWQGRTFHKDDDTRNECFRAYDDPMQSFRDHSLFLTGRPRYASLFELEITDYKGWARGLRQAGYATNPNYPDLLIRVIEQNKLYEFDRMVASGTSQSLPAPVASNQRVNTGQNTERADFAPVGLVREVKLNNRIRCVYARQGDTPETLANEMGVWTWEILRYNDLDRNDRLKAGQLVYLQPKRRNASQGWHVVSEGESLYDISQLYGVKMSSLMRRNSLSRGDNLQPGMRLKLRAFARK